jgi:lipase maturation factor 1
VAPYQPRLDWQMWFAALGNYQENNWVGGLMYRLMTGEPKVLGLLNPAPFAAPPHYMRALIYDYQFTTPAERAKTGAVWERRLLGTWFGPVSLTGQ